MKPIQLMLCPMDEPEPTCTILRTVFRSEYKALMGVDAKWDKPEGVNAARMWPRVLRAARASGQSIEDYCLRVVRAYLTDPDPWLRKQAHPFRHFYARAETYMSRMAQSVKPKSAAVVY